jgi:protocatechuate 3,4-dioxygenase beta subunit
MGQRRAGGDGLPRRRFIALGAAVVAGRVLGGCSARGSAPAASPLGDGGVPWATGGTAGMTGKAAYPDPFQGAPATTCAMTCELTKGPCYSAQSVEIGDISYGYGGLPMRMLLRLVDESCRPIAGAVVDVWHVAPTGKYSGNDPTNENVAFCTGGDPDFTSHVYFRGKQTTGADGVAAFDTCFPGWYPGRTIHVHMTLSVGGQEYVTTQLGFDDALDDAIISTQPLYDTRGARDTTNASDGVFAPNHTDYVFEARQMPDGALLAWKTIVLRSALSESLCQ